MSTGHSTIVQTDRGIGIDELSRICQVAEDFRKPDDFRTAGYSLLCWFALQARLAP